MGSLAAVLMLVVLVAIWRLIQGPIELNWLTPYVEAAFERAGVGVDVAISGVRLAIDRATHQLELKTENIRIGRTDGKHLASLPELSVSLAIGPLLSGRIAPTQLVVEHPVLHLKRDAAGAISAELQTDGQPPGDVGPELLEELARPPGRDTSLETLRRLSIRGATVIVDDEATGHTWRADRVDVAIERTGEGVRGDISFAVPIGDSRPELHANYRYIAGQRLLDLDVAVDGVQPQLLPPLIPELVQLRHVEAPVSGTLQTRIDLANGKPHGSRLSLALGKGRLHTEWLPGGSVALEQGEVQATYAPEQKEIRVEKLALDLGGGAELTVDGSLGGVTPELFAAPPDTRPQVPVRGSFTAALKQVPAARFGELWPNGFSQGGRRWAITNIHDGVLDEGSVQLVMDLDPVAHTATVVNAEGRMRYHGVSVTYFKGLPPIRKVNGTASFARNQLEFNPAGGVLKGLKLTGGSLRLANLGDPVEWLILDLAVAGPVQDALEVMDSKPLQYARAIGLEPAQVGGRADTQLHFRLPLLDDLKLDTVEYGAKATLTGVSIAKVALDRNLRDGNLALEIGRTGAQLRGTARFDEVPAKLDANVFFRPKSGPHGLYRVEMLLDDAAQRRLGFDMAPDRVTGPVTVDATYAAMSPNRGEVTALLDLRDAALTIPEAGWKKDPGQPGMAKVVLDLENEKISRIRQIDATAAGLDARLTAQLAPDKKQIDRIDIRRMALGDSDIAGTVSRRDGGWRADITATRLDARNLLKDATDGANPPPASSPLAVNARIDRLVFGPQRELRQVAAAATRSAGVWQSGHVNARHPTGHLLSLQFGEGGGRRLVFRSDDLGETLKLLDIADNVVGGKLTLDGQLSESGGRRTLRARVEGQDYTINKASLMARLLALPSLTGLASTLSGTGLPFSTLSGDLVYSGSQVSIQRLLAFGEAIGVTANGWIDFNRDRLELQGTVAPAYALNSLPGHVPIVGQLLGGGSQGLFAANYRLSGPTDDPAIMVNPLSALAPGVLRQLFAPLVGFPQAQTEQPAQ